MQIALGAFLISGPIVPQTHLVMLAIAPTPFEAHIKSFSVGEVKPAQSPLL